MKDFLKNHVPWIAWGFVIIILVSIPGKDLPEVSGSIDKFQFDKLIHVALFLVFVFLLQRGFDIPPLRNNSLSAFYFYTLSAGILFSGLTEIYQHFFIPGRNATLKDFLFNTIGSTFGWLVYSFSRETIQQKRMFRSKG